MQGRRWYDGDADLAGPVGRLFLLPEPIGVVIADGVLMLAEGRYDVIRRQQKHHGHEKILGLHKARQKQRSTDQHPVLYGAMVRFYMLDRMHRRLLGRDLNAMILNTADYLALCRKFDQTPRVEVIAALSNIYVSRDQYQAQIYLLALQKELEDVVVLKASEAGEEKPARYQPPRLIIDR